MIKKILVVDDEVSVREVLSDAFESQDYNVVTAASAEEAVRILDNDPINVIFIDLMMPGTNGIELGRKIRARNPIACLFAMTGYSRLFDLAECRTAGFDDYFTKPVEVDVLFRVASEAFARLERWTGA